MGLRSGLKFFHSSPSTSCLHGANFVHCSIVKLNSNEGVLIFWPDIVDSVCGKNKAKGFYPKLQLLSKY